MRKLWAYIMLGGILLSVKAQDCKNALDISQLKDGIAPTSTAKFEPFLNQLRNEDPNKSQGELHALIWYKFNTSGEGEFTFDIAPKSADDNYDFALFKIRSDSFCEDVKAGMILPVRAAFSEKEGKGSTGMKKDAKFKVSYPGANPSFVQSLKVKPNQSYYLLIDVVKNTPSGSAGATASFSMNYKKHAVVKEEIQKEEIKAEPKKAIEFSIIKAKEEPITLDDPIPIEAQSEMIEEVIKEPIIEEEAEIIQVAEEKMAVVKKELTEAEKIAQMIEAEDDYEDDAIIVSDELAIINDDLQPTTGDEDLSLKQEEIVVAEKEAMEAKKPVLSFEPEFLVNARDEKSKTPIEQIEYVAIPNEDGNYEVTIAAYGYEEKSEVVDMSLYPDLEEGIPISVSVEMKKHLSGTFFTLGKMHFYSNSAFIKRESEQELNNLLTFLNSNPKVSIKIHGHTNGNGSGSFDFAIPKGKKADIFVPSKSSKNQNGSMLALSQFRAASVKLFLVQNGINDIRVQIEGHGGKNPLFEFPQNDAQRDKNRRVEIEIL